MSERPATVQCSGRLRLYIQPFSALPGMGTVGQGGGKVWGLGAQSSSHWEPMGASIPELGLDGGTSLWRLLILAGEQQAE